MQKLATAGISYEPFRLEGIRRAVELLGRTCPFIIETAQGRLFARLSQFLQGRFAIKTVDGAAVGTLVVKETSAWGLGPLFRRRGGEPDDNLSICFDLGRKEAVVQLGGERLSAEEAAAALVVDDRTAAG